MAQETIKNNEVTDEDAKDNRPQTIEGWADLVREVYESKEPIESFCRNKGIRSSDFYWYRKKCITQGLIDPNTLPKSQVKNEDKKDLSFAKLDPVKMKQESYKDDTLIIRKNGWEITLDENFNENILMKVMKVMQDD